MEFQSRIEFSETLKSNFRVYLFVVGNFDIDYNSRVLSLIYTFLTAIKLQRTS